MKKSGFTLIELLVVIVIIGVAYVAVTLQISQNPIYKARDDIRKSDINALADAYTTTAIGDSQYKPLNLSILTTGKIPTPPEGGQYQGLLTQPQDYFFICAQLEKGKDLNCLLNSENPNCYCRKSKNAPPSPSISPTSSPSPYVIPSSTPIGIGTTSHPPVASSTPTPTSTPPPAGEPTPTPTPSGFNPPPVYSDLCPYQSVSQLKPQTISLQGVDGTWCYDSDQNGGYNTQGYCIDNNHNCADYCENNYPDDNVRDGYCTGTWIGFWFNVHCEYGGYACASGGMACNEDTAQAYCDVNAAPLPSLTPLPQSVTVKRVFKTSTTYNGNLGGLSGADQKCQERANANNLGETWKAWLSDSTNTAASRLSHFNGPYTLLDGTVVVDNWMDLTDGTLDRNINMTEFKNIDSNLSTVWTDTDISGNSRGKNCLNWTTSFGWPYFGGVGSGNSTLNYWTHGAGDASFVCSSTSLSLYCFEQ